MKTRYKFINFTQVAPGQKTAILWICHNNRDNHVLGAIEFYKPWKQHVIDFRENAVFNNQCLLDIADFLKQLNNIREQEK